MKELNTTGFELPPEFALVQGFNRHKVGQLPTVIRRIISIFLMTFTLMVSAKAQQPILDNGGPVFHGPIQAILIFWLPSGLHYDTNTNSAAGDTAYENILTGFFGDLSGSSYFNILSQYPGMCGNLPVTPCCAPITHSAHTFGRRKLPARTDNSFFITLWDTMTKTISSGSRQAAARRVLTAIQARRSSTCVIAPNIVRSGKS